MKNETLSDLDDLSGLTDESELPHLSDAISYETDISPYRYVQIFAGVGSGKNYFINKFVTGDSDRKIPKMIVLVITSRRAKVNELLADKEAEYSARVGKWGNMTKELYDADDWGRFKDNIRIIKDEWGEHPFYQKSVACTNAFIEKYIQNVYNPADPGTHLWNLFDMIVVDEFHSLVVDASFQTAPFYVNSLLWEIAYRHKLADEWEQTGNGETSSLNPRPLCKHLILMTGTPETVRKLPIPYMEPHVLNMMDKCVNVVPKNVWFLDAKQAHKLLEQKIASGRRCIYFMNHVMFPEPFCKGTSISPESVVMSFSDEKRRKPLEDYAKIPEDKRTKDKQKFARIYENMVEVENCLSSSGLIPPQYKLLLTTSRNKEGINIKSEDINDVFVESHHMSDIIQMAGRVRRGAENLYIIVDSCGHSNNDYPYENVLANDEFAPDAHQILEGTCSVQDGAINRHLLKVCKAKGFSNFFANRDSDFRPFHGKQNIIREFIKYVHDRNDRRQNQRAPGTAWPHAIRISQAIGNHPFQRQCMGNGNLCSIHAVCGRAGSFIQSNHRLSSVCGCHYHQRERFDRGGYQPAPPDRCPFALQKPALTPAPEQPFRGFLQKFVSLYSHHVQIPAVYSECKVDTEEPNRINPPLFHLNLLPTSLFYSFYA